MEFKDVLELFPSLEHLKIMFQEQRHFSGEQHSSSCDQHVVSDNDDTDMDISNKVANNDETSFTDNSEPTFMDLQKSSALMLLQLKEVHKLTQASLQGIIDNVTELCQNHLSAIHCAVTQAITNAGLSPNDIEGLNDIFSTDNEFGRPFFGLETQHQQFKFYRENFKIVVRK